MNFRSTGSASRLRNPSLALGALVIYRMNALIYRPAEGKAEEKLLHSACQHVLDGADGTRPIMYGRG